GLWQPFDMMDVMKDEILGLGLTRVRLTVNSLEQVTEGKTVVELTRSEFIIDPNHDEIFTILAENGVQITYTLSFWDKDCACTEEVLSGPRFKTEDQIQRYLDFTQFIVSHFKDRVQYFEIWNEPELDVPGQRIDVEDYVHLVKQAVPVIRQEAPGAKIQVGGSPLRWGREYLFDIFKSDIMPLVDAISWHPFYGESPECCAEYYYSYPSVVREIKSVASSHGFQGEYVADELNWWVYDQTADQPWRYSNEQAAKYHARSIVLHLGMDIAVSLNG
ncbi:unnamed protein product, partial [marine sediment metagenome]